MWSCIITSMLAAANPSPTDLAPPVQLLAGGQPINVDVGHAAPFVADLSGDGKMTLVVGQFGEGKLRLYPKVGTRSEPRFTKFECVQAGNKLGTVPTGGCVGFTHQF